MVLKERVICCGRRCRPFRYIRSSPTMSLAQRAVSLNWRLMAPVSSHNLTSPPAAPRYPGMRIRWLLLQVPSLPGALVAFAAKHHAAWPSAPASRPAGDAVTRAYEVEHGGMERTHPEVVAPNVVLGRIGAAGHDVHLPAWRAGPRRGAVVIVVDPHPPSGVGPASGRERANAHVAAVVDRDARIEPRKRSIPDVRPVEVDNPALPKAGGVDVREGEPRALPHGPEEPNLTPAR